MPLDFKKLREKYKKIDENTGGGATWYKPKSGRNVIRILPAKDGGNDFYQEILRHSNLDSAGLSKPFINCRKTDENEDECALCEFAEFMKNSDSKKEQDIGKSISARPRFFMNVCLNSKNDLDNENWNEVMVYDCPPTVFREILSNITDEDYIDEDGNSLILDPDEGFDFVIEKTGKGRFNTSYTVKTRPKQSSVHIKDWKEKLNDLSVYAEINSAKEMEAFVQSEDEEEDDEEEETKSKYRRKKEASHHKRRSRKDDYEDEDDLDDDEDFDEDEEDEKAKPKHKKRRSVRKSDDKDDESDDVADEILEEAKRVSKKNGSSRVHRKKRKVEEPEDEEEFDDEEDDFEEDDE